MAAAFRSVSRAWSRLTFNDVLPELKAVAQPHRGKRSAAGKKRRLRWCRIFRRCFNRRRIKRNGNGPSRRAHQQNDAGAGVYWKADEANFPVHDDLFEKFAILQAKKVKMPFARAILSSRKREWIWTAVLCVIADVGWVLIPTLLHFINRFAKREHYTQYGPSKQQALRDGGFGFAVGLLVLQTLQYICATHVKYRLDMMGTRLQTTVSNHLLETRLRRTGPCDDETKSDTKVEAAAIEDLAEEIGDAASSGHRVWTLPFAIIVGAVILIKRLEVASVAGLAVLLVGTPVVAKLSVVCKRHLHQGDTSRAERRRRMLQLVSGDRDGFSPKEGDRKALVDDLIHLREEELRTTRSWRAGELACQVTIANLPNIGAAVSMCILQVQGRLNSTTIVLTLTSFHAMRIVMSQWPRAVGLVVSGRHACRKIEQMLATSPAANTDKDGKDGVEIEAELRVAVRLDRTSWTKLGDGATHDTITLAAEHAELVAVFTQSPDSPSSIMSILLGVGRTRSATLFDAPAYCPPTPWMVNDNVRQNVLLSGPYNDDRYRAVLTACHLIDDFDPLRQSDEVLATSLEKSVQQRISLARALYSTSPIVVVDRFPFQQHDPLFHDALRNLQPGRCRIIITTDINVARQCDRIVQFTEEGCTSISRTTSSKTRNSEELNAHHPRDRQLRLSTVFPSGSNDTLVRELVTATPRTLNQHETPVGTPNDRNGERTAVSSDTTLFQATQGNVEHRNKGQPDQKGKKSDSTPSGNRKAQPKSAWRAYFHAAQSYWLIAALIIPYLFSTAGGLLLSIWALHDTYLTGGAYVSPYAHIGGIIGLVFWHATSQFVFLFFAIMVVGERAGRNLHREALRGLTKIPKKAQQTPAQVVHRFVNDLDIAAVRAPQTMSRYSLTVGIVVVAFVLTAAIMPYLVALIVPATGLAVYFCARILRFFLQLQRNNRQEKSAEHEAVAEALTGANVISAFHYEADYMSRIQRLQRNQHHTEKLKSKSGEWLTMRMSSLSSLVLFASCASIVGASSTPLLAGAVLIHLYIATRSASRAGHQYLGIRRGLMAVKRLSDLSGGSLPARPELNKARHEKVGGGQDSRAVESSEAEAAHM